MFETTVSSNTMWHEICSDIDPCSPHDDFSGSLDDTVSYVDALKNVSALEIWSHSNDYGIAWGPTPNDGLFFNNDPRENLSNLNLTTNIPYFITTNSYEGGILDWYMHETTFSWAAFDYQLASFYGIKDTVRHNRSGKLLITGLNHLNYFDN